MRYPAAPTVDEIVAVMCHTADNRHGWYVFLAGLFGWVAAIAPLAPYNWRQPRDTYGGPLAPTLQNLAPPRSHAARPVSPTSSVPVGA
jgi:hypothetical protein